MNIPNELWIETELKIRKFTGNKRNELYYLFKTIFFDGMVSIMTDIANKTNDKSTKMFIAKSLVQISEEYNKIENKIRGNNFD